MTLHRKKDGPIYRYWVRCDVCGKETKPSRRHPPEYGDLGRMWAVDGAVWPDGFAWVSAPVQPAPGTLDVCPEHGGRQCPSCDTPVHQYDPTWEGNTATLTCQKCGHQQEVTFTNTTPTGH